MITVLSMPLPLIQKAFGSLYYPVDIIPSLFAGISDYALSLRNLEEMMEERRI